MVGKKLSLSQLISQHKISVLRGPDVVIKQIDDRNITTVSNYGVTARIVEADIECTNGYIHLIDTVIIKVS